MRRAAKVDSNHPEILAAFRQLGCSVLPLHQLGGGVPDALIGLGGRSILVEIKAGKGQLNEGQAIWHADWKGAIATVRDMGGVITTVKLLRSP